MQRTVNFGDFAVEVKRDRTRTLCNDTSVSGAVGTVGSGQRFTCVKRSRS
jgi:hypothetical protein